MTRPQIINPRTTCCTWLTDILSYDARQKYDKQSLHGLYMAVRFNKYLSFSTANGYWIITWIYTPYKQGTFL